MNRKEEMELLPCPFCGTQPHSHADNIKHNIDDEPYNGQWIIECNACPVDSSTWGASQQIATKQWNTRAALRSSAAPEEGMKKVWDEGEHEGCGKDSERAFAVERLQRLISEKLDQLRHYKENCQLDHAKAVAEGRIQQAEQIGHWIADLALPSDSGKAAPVGWLCPVDPDIATAFRWKRPEDGLCNSFGCKKQLVPVYAALAPATGITEERVLNALEIAGLAWEGAVIIRSGKKVPTQAVMNFARALSPSPSVGTRTLNEWIEREFAGHGCAIRTKDEAAYSGEPYMSMADAKELTRRAVATFGGQ